jgi:hypothetical protein
VSQRHTESVAPHWQARLGDVAPACYQSALPVGHCQWQAPGDVTFNLNFFLSNFNSYFSPYFFSIIITNFEAYIISNFGSNFDSNCISIIFTNFEANSLTDIKAFFNTKCCSIFCSYSSTIMYWYGNAYLNHKSRCVIKHHVISWQYLVCWLYFDFTI